LTPDIRSLLADAAQAGRIAVGFLQGRSPSDLDSDVLLRSGVRYQLLVVGEALGQAAKSAPEIATKLPDLPKIVAFRNVLAHDYSRVNEVVVWDVVRNKLPQLVSALDRLLHDLGDAPVR